MYDITIYDSVSWKVFKEAIKAAVAYKEHSTDFLDDVMRELEVSVRYL